MRVWDNSGVRPGAVAHDSNPTVRRAGNTAGFTLVELLVVITIIMISAGITLGAFQAARQAARAVKTQATITKIDNIIRHMVESYATRRIPLSDFAVQAIATSNSSSTILHSAWDPGLQYWDPKNSVPACYINGQWVDITSANYGVPWQMAAFIRLAALRDIMRMEMPELATNITNPPIFANAGVWAAGTCPDVFDSLEPGRQQPTPQRFRRVPLHDRHALDPDAASRFSDSEIGDTDNNGLPEFLDGWGNPILFFRWSPGFTDTDIQPVVIPSTDPPGTPYNADPAIQANMTADAGTDHDPFDTRRVDATAWRLVPLIYSTGPNAVWTTDSYGNPVQDPGLVQDASGRVRLEQRYVLYRWWVGQ